MKELIKKIRADLGLNQEQLASLMGISPVTVNRWENGKANPSFMAQNQALKVKYDLLVAANVILVKVSIWEQIHCSHSRWYVTKKVLNSILWSWT